MEAIIENGKLTISNASDEEIRKFMKSIYEKNKKIDKEAFAHIVKSKYPEKDIQDIKGEVANILGRDKV